MKDEFYCPGSKNRNVDPSVHIMNKNERKVLRKLKAKHKLSEEDLRKCKENRITLSEAQKLKGNNSKLERHLLVLQKCVTKELKLPKEHPLVTQKIIMELNSERQHWGSGFTSALSNEQLLKILSTLNNKK